MLKCLDVKNSEAGFRHMKEYEKEVREYNKKLKEEAKKSKSK